MTHRIAFLIVALAAAPLWLGLAQRYALQRSLAQGLSPDNPFPDGTVNRVVQGVTIHH